MHLKYQLGRLLKSTDWRNGAAAIGKMIRAEGKGKSKLNPPLPKTKTIAIKPAVLISLCLSKLSEALRDACAYIYY
jgi:hypothetical protein